MEFQQSCTSCEIIGVADVRVVGKEGQEGVTYTHTHTLSVRIRSRSKARIDARAQAECLSEFSSEPQSYGVKLGEFATYVRCTCTYNT